MVKTVWGGWNMDCRLWLYHARKLARLPGGVFHQVLSDHSDERHRAKEDKKPEPVFVKERIRYQWAVEDALAEQESKKQAKAGTVPGAHDGTTSLLDQMRAKAQAWGEKQRAEAAASAAAPAEKE